MACPYASGGRPQDRQVESTGDELMFDFNLLAQFDLHAEPARIDEGIYTTLRGATFPFSEALTACGALWNREEQAWQFGDETSLAAFSAALSEIARGGTNSLAEEASPFVTSSETQTPLNRFLERGANALENEDLLELLLSFDNYVTDPQTMSQQLFDEFGSLGAILSSEPERLTRLEGVTPRVHGLLKAIQLSIERVLHENVKKNPIIGSSQALLDFLNARLRHRQREELIAIYMDRQNRLIKVESAQGTVGHVHLSPRDVATRALELFATSVIIAHNHPGGDKRPSRGDVGLTKQLHLALKALNMELYDHVIVCDESCFSFKSEGLI